MALVVLPEIVMLNVLSRLDDPADKLKLFVALPNVRSIMPWTLDDLKFEVKLLYDMEVGIMDWAFKDAEGLSKSCEMSMYRRKLIIRQYLRYLTEIIYQVETDFTITNYPDLDAQNLWLHLSDIEKGFVLNYRCDVEIPLYFGLVLPIDGKLDASNQFFCKYSLAIWNCCLELRKSSQECLECVEKYLLGMKNLHCLTIHFNPDNFLEDSGHLRLKKVCFPKLRHLQTIKFQGRLSSGGLIYNTRIIQEVFTVYGHRIQALAWELLADSELPTLALLSANVGRCTKLKWLNIIGFNTTELLTNVLLQLKVVALKGLFISCLEVLKNISATFFELLSVVAQLWHKSLQSLKIILEPYVLVGPDGALGPHFVFKDLVFSELTTLYFEISLDTFERDNRRDMDWDFLLLFPKLKELTLQVDFRCFRNGIVHLPPDIETLQHANVWSILPELETISFRSEETTGLVKRLNGKF